MLPSCEAPVHPNAKLLAGLAAQVWPSASDDSLKGSSLHPEHHGCMKVGLEHFCICTSLQSILDQLIWRWRVPSGANRLIGPDISKASTSASMYPGPHTAMTKPMKPSATSVSMNPSTSQQGPMCILSQRMAPGSQQKTRSAISWMVTHHFHPRHGFRVALHCHLSSSSSSR